MREAALAYLTAAETTIRTWLVGVPGLSEIAAAPYLFRPVLLICVLGVVGGAVSALVNLRGLEFNAEATVHSVFPGIVVGLLAGGVGAITTGGLLAGAMSVAALSVVTARRSAFSEAVVALVLTGLYSLGLVILLRSKDRSGQLEALMFGRLLEFTVESLGVSLLLCAIAATLVATTWKAQVAIAFDPVNARLRGYRTTAMTVILNSAIGLVVLAASTAVGVLLAVGVLVVPGAAARFVAHRTCSLAIASCLFATVGSLSGLLLAIRLSPLPISPQASVMCGVLTGYLLAVGFYWLRRWRIWRPQGTDSQPHGRQQAARTQVGTPC